MKFVYSVDIVLYKWCFCALFSKELFVMKKFLLAISALFILSSCSSTKKNMDSAYEHGDTSSNVENVSFAKEVGDRVYFAFDSADLDTDSKAHVARMAKWLEAHPSTRFIIEGHCDERGSREYNIALGEKRASKVEHQLIHLGVNKDRMKTVSYGKERLAAVGDTEAVHQLNRRSVIVIE